MAPYSFSLVFFAVIALGYIRTSLALQTRSSSTPSRNKIAVLLRGEMFRWKWGGCLSNATEHQWEALDSFKEFVIGYFEQQNYTVDIVVADSAESGYCNLTEKYLDRLGRSRIIGAHTFDAANQSDNIRQGLDLLKNATNQNVAQYDLVMVARHDLVWSEDTAPWNWQADMSNFNFQMSCRQEGWTSSMADVGDNCVVDQVHVMPGRAFDAFDSAVGSNGSYCYENKAFIRPITCTDSGHCCFDAIKNNMEAIGVGVGALYPDWSEYIVYEADRGGIIQRYIHPYQG